MTRRAAGHQDPRKQEEIARSTTESRDQEQDCEE